MIYGNWVGIHKGFVKSLPIDRPYTELEAVFSLSVDADFKNPASISGYSKLWSWSRSKVRRFLADIEVEIIYPEELKKKQNQKGQIKGQIRDRSETDKRQARFIIDKGLYRAKNRSETDKGQMKDRSKNTTIDPYINPNPNPKNKSSKTFDDDGLEIKIAKYFYAVLLKSEPGKKEPNFQNWCKEIDLLIRVDNKSPEDIKAVINYAHDPKNSSDSFSWIPNLRSPKKLRKHFTTILLQSKQKTNKQSTSDYLQSLLDETEENEVVLNREDYESI